MKGNDRKVSEEGKAIKLLESLGYIVKKEEEHLFLLAIAQLTGYNGRRYPTSDLIESMGLTAKEAKRIMRVSPHLVDDDIKLEFEDLIKREG